MLKKYFDGVKGDLLPEVTDWCDSQDKFRFEKNVNRLSYKEWFWLHPSAYHLFNFSTDALFSFMMLLVIVWGVLRGWWFVLFLCSVIFFFSFRSLIRKVGNYKYVRFMNMYDVFMREEKNECD